MRDAGTGNVVMFSTYNGSSWSAPAELPVIGLPEGGRISSLAMEFGGTMTGEHGDGILRSCWLEKMYGPRIVEAFRRIKTAFDPQGIFNPGKIVDPLPMLENLRFSPREHGDQNRPREGAQTNASNAAQYSTATNGRTHLDFSLYGGMSGLAEMCSGVGQCRQKLVGTMCPSYMATKEEAHTTRGRANVLRLAMTGRLGEAGLGDDGVRGVLDLCLECRACKAECPVGVDVARFKSEFLADYWTRHGTPLKTRALGHVHELAQWMRPIAPLASSVVRSWPVRWLNERLLGLDRRRKPPAWISDTFTRQFSRRTPSAKDPSVLLFRDTFTDFYNPQVGLAGADVLEAAGTTLGIAPNVCCGRPLISQGLLAEARERAATNLERLFPLAVRGARFVFFEPSCLSAIKEDGPDLLRGDAQRRARELEARGESVDRGRLLLDIEERDRNDTDREHAPLRPAEDSVAVDTTGKGVDDVVDALARLVAKALSGPTGADRREDADPRGGRAAGT
jgi:Fe-S oxidoreductase